MDGSMIFCMYDLFNGAILPGGTEDAIQREIIIILSYKY
jgi:hypothetical protein